MNYKKILVLCLLGTASVFPIQALAGGATVGGDCCADLEERVAELEATTVRKGNRKVSLTISGSVHRAVLFTDEKLLVNGMGLAPDVKKYDKGPMITDTAQAHSTIRLYGLAAINRDLYVGYRLDLGLGAGGTKEDGNPYKDLITIHHNEILIGSRTFGNLYIGKGYTASDFAAEQDLSGTNYIASGSTSHFNAVGNLDGFGRQERIRYESPSVGGFKVSASWQEEGHWDAAINYKGTLGDFQLVGALAYFQLGAETFNQWHDASFGTTTQAQSGDKGVSGSLSALHTPTGLSLTFAAGEVDNIGVTHGNNYVTDFWYLKAGLQRKLLDAGKTYLSVDYHNLSAANINASTIAVPPFFALTPKQNEVEKWGVQLVQDIDAAAMKVYASYWNAKGSYAPGDIANFDEEALMIGVNIDF